MKRPKVSILTPSINDNNILKSHVEWFAGLDNHDFELIVIDQSSSVSKFILNYENKISNFLYKHHNLRGLSLNRNYGLQFVNGDYVMFLDDNAHFDSEMAKMILDSLDMSNVDVLLCAISDENGNLTSYTPHKSPSSVTIASLEGRVNSNGIIVKNDLANKIRFDEKMGVGALYGACEEVDFLVRILLDSYKVYYNPLIKIVHPPVDYNLKKARSYGEGHGFFVDKLLFKYSSPSCKFFALRRIFKFILKFQLSFVPFLKKNVQYRVWCKGFVRGFINGEK